MKKSKQTHRFSELKNMDLCIICVQKKRKKRTKSILLRRNKEAFSDHRPGNQPERYDVLMLYDRSDTYGIYIHRCNSQRLPRRLRRVSTGWCCLGKQAILDVGRLQEANAGENSPGCISEASVLCVLSETEAGHKRGCTVEA